MTKVLFLGFDIFGQYQHNPTRDIALSMENTYLSGSGPEIIASVLPCSYARAPALAIDLIKAFQPVAILAMGLHSRVPGITLEHRAWNRKGSKYADVDGEVFTEDSGAMIDPSGPEFYLATANYMRIAGILNQEGIGVVHSSDAETFVCNNLFWRICDFLARSGLATPFCFVHIPWTDKYSDLVEIPPEKKIIPHGVAQYAARRILKIMYPSSCF